MTHPRVSHEEWLARFDGYLHQQGYRARTIRRYRTVCQQFLQYLTRTRSRSSRWTLRR